MPDDGMWHRTFCPNCNALVRTPSGAATATATPRSLLEDLLEEVRQLEGLPPAVASGPAVHVQEGSAAAPTRTHFPQRSSKAYAEKTPAYRGQTIAVVCGLFAVFLVAYLALHTIRVGIRTQAVRAALQSANSEKGSLKALLRSGDRFRDEHAYQRALDSYRTVATRARPLLDRLRESGANLEPGALKDETDAARKELSGYLNKAMEGLDAPEGKFGAQGLVDFDGEWVTPEQKKGLLEAKMKAEGLELYAGKWLTEEEIRGRKGEVLYKGRWVTRAERDRLVAAEKRQQARTPTPTPPRTRPRAPRLRARDIARKFRPDAATWNLDDFEGKSLDWTAVPWKKEEANPCSLGMVTGSATGRLKITLLGGVTGKSAIVRPIGLDFSTRTRVRMDVFNDCGEPLRVAIALQTNSYYESRWQSLKIGQNKNVTFDLTSGDYKCAATHWSPATPIARLQSVGYLYILFYNLEGEILLDNIVALGGG